MPGPKSGVRAPPRRSAPRRHSAAATAPGHPPGRAATAQPRGQPGSSRRRRSDGSGSPRAIASARG
eukprot:11290171-Alexandrium_andersonii.AAC.1